MDFPHQQPDRKPISKDKIRMYMRAESHAISREVMAAFLLWRWVDHAEAEREAVAVFEDRTFESILPSTLQWKFISRIDQPDQVADRLHALVAHLNSENNSPGSSVGAWLKRLTPLFERMAKVNSTYLLIELQRVAELPFETPSDRLEALKAFDEDLDARSDPHHGQYTTPSNIARLVAALADPQPGERIYDPCFGSGNFLIEANRHAQRNQGSPRRSRELLDIAGVEINQISFIVGLVRMLLAGIETPSLELGNSLERDAPGSPGQQGFDLVLANPPINAKSSRESSVGKHYAFPTSDALGMFVQHALAQLKPSGRAVIVVPEGFLFRSGPERELRKYLLERGHVEAVVGLPAGSFAPYTNIKGSILVLRRAGGVKRIRMMDATQLFEARAGRAGPVLSSVMAQQLAEEVKRQELREPRELPKGVLEGMPGTGALSRSVWDVSVDELCLADWDLTPRRRDRGGLDDSLASLGDRVQILPLLGVVNMMTGRAIKSADLLEHPEIDSPSMGYIRIKDLNNGKVGRPSSWVCAPVAAAERRWTLRSGDILLSKSGTIGKAAIVRNGTVGALAANGLYVLRTDQERLDAGFLIAYLASEQCKAWLAARSRGVAIQHLSRSALESLPIPLPPLPIQARAAAHFRDFGTDALTFLEDSTGGKAAERLTAWLGKMDSRLPRLNSGRQDLPPIAEFEFFGLMAEEARSWVLQDGESEPIARWLMPFTEALMTLSGVSQIPPGSALLSVLKEAESGLLRVMPSISGHTRPELQVREVAERMLQWLRLAITALVSKVEIQIRSTPSSVTAGSFAEFTVELESLGALPLRSVQVDVQPDWGSISIPFLAERGTITINLRGDVPRNSDNLTLKLSWQAHTLSGQLVVGSVELAIRVVPQDVPFSTIEETLGGSPYVCGSPLEPRHGHDVFFGREGLIGQISRQIATHGNVVLLEGNRRAGKTSILKHLEGRTAIPGWLAVYTSLQGAEGDKQFVGVPTAEVFRIIATEIGKALIKLDLDVPLPNGRVVAKGEPALGIASACRDGISDDSPFNDFRDYLEVVLSLLEPLQLGIVLMLDEFDKLQEGIDNGVTSPQVPENIRFLIQNYPKFSAILTGSRRLKRLREEYWSALYGLGTSISVTSLDIQSARNVVTQPVGDRLTYSNEAIEKVIELTARQPYLMQCLCNRIFEFAVQTKSRSITLSVVNDAGLGLVRDNEHFASLWIYASRGPSTGRLRRQLILLLCARSFKQGAHLSFGTLREQLTQAGVDIGDDALDIDLAYLRELDLIDFIGESGEGEYRLAIPLMADWIEQQQDSAVVFSRAGNEAEDENAGS